MSIMPEQRSPGEANALATVAQFAASAGGTLPRLAPDAIAYLQRHDQVGADGLRKFALRAAAVFPEREIDEPLAAILLHGERRHVDRWVQTAAHPLPMPNRRRPPPIVAAEEVIDVNALLDDLAGHWPVAPQRTAFGVAETAHLLGLRPTTPVERTGRRRVVRPVA